MTVGEGGGDGSGVYGQSDFFLVVVFDFLAFIAQFKDR